MRARLLWSLVGLLIFPLHLSASPPGPRTDEDIAHSAQVVVVARVKENSLKNIPHQDGAETQAVLLITRVLKGNITVQELPIMLNSSALPVPKKRITASFGDYDPDFPLVSPYSYDYSEPIPLYEFNIDGPVTKVLDDVRKEQIWFLRPYQWIAETKVKPGTLGILDYRDVQPLSKEKDFKAIIK